MKTEEQIKIQIEEYRKFLGNDEYEQLSVVAYIDALQWVIGAQYGNN